MISLIRRVGQILFQFQSHVLRRSTTLAERLPRIDRFPFKPHCHCFDVCIALHVAESTPVASLVEEKPWKIRGAPRPGCAVNMTVLVTVYPIFRIISFQDCFRRFYSTPCCRNTCDTTERRGYKARISEYLLTKSVLNPRSASRAAQATLALSPARPRATDANNSLTLMSSIPPALLYVYPCTLKPPTAYDVPAQRMFPSAEEGRTRAFLPQYHLGFASAIFRYLYLLSADTRKRRDVIMMMNAPALQYARSGTTPIIPSDPRTQFHNNLKKTTPVTPASQGFTKPPKYGAGTVDLWRHPGI